jgi:DNA-binding transcriptional regulator YhcF (GntR family)
MAQSPIDFRLDRDSDVPLGTQLAWKLRGGIASGRLQPGDRLPAVRELADAAAVNVNTVRSVYARLGDQGLIVSEHGRGTFVSESLRDEAELRDLAERTAVEASRHGVDPRELAAVLYSQSRSASPRAAAPPVGTAARASLRTRIATLERELAEIDQELTLLEEPPPPSPAPAPRRRRGAGARLLASDQLEAVHESLSMQVAERRVQLELARERHRLGPREEGRKERAPSVATRSPDVVVGGGTWTLRWRV